MTKSELLTGMTVTLRNGERKIVYLKACSFCNPEGMNILIGSEFWSKLDDYNNDLTYNGDAQRDIIKVEIPNVIYDLFHPLSETNRSEIIWERPEPRKKITISEIEAILGYKVEIINDK